MSNLYTGIPSLDLRLGGSIPRGTLIEMFGYKSSGRSALGLAFITNAQKKGFNCALIDADDTYDRLRAIYFGVDETKLWYSEVKYLEDVLDHAAIAAEHCDLTVVDSMASVPSHGEKITSSHYKNRRIISDKLRKLSHSVRQHNNTVVIINQGRQNIGYQNLEVNRSYYGDLVKIYAGRRIKLIEGATARDGAKKVGVYIYAKVMKQLGVPPYDRTKLRLESSSFDVEGDLLDLALQTGILTRKGSYLFYRDVNLGNSYKDIKVTIRSESQLWKRLRSEVMERLELYEEAYRGEE
jgi:recombination protein RecA